MWLRFFFVTILLFILCGCSPSPHHSPSKEVKGTIDLSGWNFEKEGTVSLSGEWAFYWKKLYTPGDFKKPVPKPVWVQVPDAWNHYHMRGHDLPGPGYATYRLHVHVKNPDQALAIKIPYVFTAYKMWINGKQVAVNGTVGTSKASSKPQSLIQIATFKGNADIIVQVSNFQHRWGGLVNPLMIGTTKEIVRSINIHIGEQLLLFGSLLIIGIYYMVLYGFRRRSLNYLIFGLICVILAIHNQFEGEVPITQFFPHANWGALLRLEYITADLGKILLFPLFFHFLYPNLLHRKVLWVTSVLSVIFFVVALTTPTILFSRYYMIGNIADILTMLYLWAILLKAVLQKRENARIILFCFTVFIITVFNDILNAMEIIHTGSFIAAGLYFFILGLALVLAINFSQAFTMTEKLSHELTQLNQSLEEKVQTRTREMEESNQTLRETNEQLKDKNEQIREYEESRRHLLTNISHELRTPITLIQGYLEALIYNVIENPEKRHQNLVQIHSKTIRLNQLIEDLFELSRIEVKQASFKIKFVEVLPWIEDVFARYSKDVKQAEIHFTSQEDLTLMGNSWGVKIDAARMDQVLSNMIFNAIKHTHVHGVIKMIVDLLPIENLNEEKMNKTAVPVPVQLRIRISDNGHGIPKRDLPHIFERFYQAKNTGTKQGTGLGLAISKAIIEYHGGTIGVESKEGEGSTFFLTLPLFQEM